MSSLAAATLTPAPAVATTTAADALAHDFGGWRRIVDDPPADLDPWARWSGAPRLGPQGGVSQRELVRESVPGLLPGVACRGEHT